jgi:hypothetical protein
VPRRKTPTPLRLTPEEREDIAAGRISALGHEVAAYRRHHHDATLDNLIAHLESRIRVKGSPIMHVGDTRKLGVFVEWRPRSATESPKPPCAWACH